MWDVKDVLEEYARERLQTLRWQIAASPLAPSQVVARYHELERSVRKEERMDALMERLAAERRAAQN